MAYSEDVSFPKDTKWLQPEAIVKPYWIVKGSLFSLLLTITFLFPLLFYSIYLFLLVFFLAFIACFAIVVLWSILFYDRYFYRIGEDGVYINRGIWFKSKRTIPYERIQHLSVTKGPLEIIFGISDLNIYTAGTSSLGSSFASRGMFGAEGFIPGLKDPEPLREEIWRRVKLAKSGSGLGDEQFQSLQRRGQAGISLDEILKELKRIRTVLEEIANSYKD